MKWTKYSVRLPLMEGLKIIYRDQNTINHLHITANYSFHAVTLLDISWVLF